MHAVNSAKPVAQLQREEVSAELIAGFREAMQATEKKLLTSAVENAEMFGLLKVKDSALQQARSEVAELQRRLADGEAGQKRNGRRCGQQRMRFNAQQRLRARQKRG